MNRKAKIVATIGPASNDKNVIEKMLLAGMNVVRINFSHGIQQEHADWTNRVRTISRRIGLPLAVMQDLHGPKIRIGNLVGVISLAVGETVVLIPQHQHRQENTHKKWIPVDSQELFIRISVGDRILLDDGRIELIVQKVDEKTITTQVKSGGNLSSNKGINLPGISLDIPSITEKDKNDLAFGLSLGVDAVALSFVRTAKDVQSLRQMIINLSPQQIPLVIAKLERPEAVGNLEEILEVSDGVMIARGDLGVEMAPEEVPGVQKKIIQTTNQKGKLVITATQMLESMISNSLPTRAEASDVANAIYDGTDAVMLSGETAIGKYPVDSIAMMDRIVQQAEKDMDLWGYRNNLKVWDNDDAAALAQAARELAHDRDVAAIAVFTRTGRSAMFMAKARPCVPILAFTPETTTYNRLAFFWGIQPYRVPFADTVEEMIKNVEGALKNTRLVQPGQQVVLVAGYPLKEIRPPNMALLHRIS